MALFQRTLTAAIAATALAGAFSLPAVAQTQAAPAAPATAEHAHPMKHRAAHPGAHAPRHADFAKQHAARLERTKTLLQLQPQQQAAWDKYVAATTPQPRTSPQPRPDLGALDTLQRLDLQQRLRQERNAQAEQREAATRSFYSSLNPQQQKAFDALALGQHRPGPRGFHGPAKSMPSHHAPAAHHGVPQRAS